MDIVDNDLKEQENKFRESQHNLRLTDEDLVIQSTFDGRKNIFNILCVFFQATTRINYEEQISVLTEQVISLSDQLAELK